MVDSGFVTDGHKRAIKGLEPRLETLRVKIQQEIEDQFAPQLAIAGFLKRQILRARMRRELRRRLAEIVRKNAPPDALYSNNR